MPFQFKDDFYGTIRQLFDSRLIVSYVDGRIWEVNSTFAFTSTRHKIAPDIYMSFSIPQGFTTDFASIPRVLWSILPPNGKYAPAAVLHDYLYRGPYVTRKVADLLFLEAMEELKVGLVTRQLMYRAVRMFGTKSYKGPVEGAK